MFRSQNTNGTRAGRGLRVVSPLLILVACGISLAQQPIRVRTNLVNIGFTARDAKGVLVDNLSQENIQLFEDTVQQKISYFQRSVDVPLTLGLVVDESGSQESEAKRHEHDIQVFLESVLGPKDRVFLVCFENRIRLVSDFTNSGSELMDRWHEYNTGGDKKKNNKNNKKEKNDTTKPDFPDIGPKESRVLGTAFYDAIYYSISEKLARESGRRALLVFSDGEDNSSEQDMMSTIEEAQYNDVLLYSIRYTEESHGKLTARNKYGIRVMQRIAGDTGAEDFDAKQMDAHEYFKAIGEELRTMYEVGYYSTNSENDRTFRKVQVKYLQDGIKIHSKPGYYAR